MNQTYHCPLCGEVLRPLKGEVYVRPVRISNHRARHRPWTSIGREYPLLPVETFGEPVPGAPKIRSRLPPGVG